MQRRAPDPGARHRLRHSLYLMLWLGGYRHGGGGTTLNVKTASCIIVAAGHEREMLSAPGEGMSNALLRAFAASRSVEAAHTYAKVDEPPAANQPEQPDASFDAHSFEDGLFWTLSVGQLTSGSTVRIRRAVLSEWVPRVPGLYWSLAAKALRSLSIPATEIISGRWEAAYPPFRKSIKVSGGIGTVRLPPSISGDRLVCMTSSLNASAGVPILIKGEVWEQLRLSEGTVIDGMVRWQALDSAWGQHFPVLRGLVRGCLVVDDPKQVRVVRDQEPVPVQIHPYSVMEYRKGAALLYDFVYATADTGDANWRSTLADFFEGYRTAGGRGGEYLLAADASEPLWDARYDSPSALRAASRAVTAGLGLIETRVQEQLSGQSTIEALLKALGGMTPTDLRMLSDDAGISPAQWFSGGPIAEEVTRLVHVATGSGGISALIEALALRYPKALASTT
jgi:hypothetical protein